MTIDCIRPTLVAIYPRGSSVKKDGSPGRKVIFGLVDQPDPWYPTGEAPDVIQVPCGKCLNCRKAQAFAWSLRCQMEQLSYEPDECCFLTLTYAPNVCPDEINYSHFQRFMHTLRCRVAAHDPGKKLRFFASFEYGSHTGRPHAHVLLFGYDFFADARVVGKSGEHCLFDHPWISSAWYYGIANFGYVTPASCMYVAQYQQKKLIDGDESVYADKVQPFIRMSRRPGIGSAYIEQHRDQIIKDMGVYLDGKFIHIDRFVLRKLFSEESVDGVNFAFDLHKKADFVKDLRLRQFARTHDTDLSGYLPKIAELTAGQEEILRARKLSKGEVF